MRKQVAESAEAVTGAGSRRRFLGRLTRLAGGVAAGVAGLLAGKTAEAGAGRGKGPKGRLCCWYSQVAWDVWPPTRQVCTNQKTCPDLEGYILTESFPVDNCEDCYGY